jgi:outer membrane receptor protein involved in Fe transport
LFGGLVTKKRFWKQFDLDPQTHLNSAIIDDNRDFELFGFKQDWDYEISKNVLLKLGADIKRLTVSYNYSKDIWNEFITADDSLTEQVENFNAVKTQDGNQLGLYLASRLKILSPLTLETGIRYDYASYTNDRLWSPRISMAYSLGKATFMRAAWGKYYQTQGIDDLDIQFSDLAYHPAELAEHFVLGLDHLFTNGLHFRAEGYYKKMSNLRDEYYSFRDIDEFFPEARDDLVRLSLNKATSRGIELFLKYDTGNKFSWWLSYVLSDAKDDVADIHYDGSLEKRTGMLPRAWDQRHTVNIDANYRLNKKWHFNFAWRYRTGWPSTDFTVQRIQRANGSFAYYHDRGVFRGSRVPSYQRLDARINRHFHTSRGKISVFLHVINLYNHENVIRYDHEILESNPDTFRAEIVPETWFSITPFAGFSWEF